MRSRARWALWECRCRNITPNATASFRETAVAPLARRPACTGHGHDRGPDVRGVRAVARHRVGVQTTSPLRRQFTQPPKGDPLYAGALWIKGLSKTSTEYRNT